MAVMATAEPEERPKARFAVILRVCPFVKASTIVVA